MVSCSGSLVPSCFGKGWVVISPSTLLRLPAALYGACPVLCVVPALRCSIRERTQLHLHFVPSLAQAAQAARSLMGALSLGVVRLLPSTIPASVSARASRVRAPCVSPRPSLWMSTIQNLRKSLVRNWRPACSVVGDAVLGAEPAPFPSPLPPASGGAGPVCSQLAPLDLLSPFVL